LSAEVIPAAGVLILQRTRGETREETSIVETDVSKDVDKSKHLLVTSGVHVMGYLNLFSDAVHNFTDGMSLGTAFLLHGTVGGWSRTLFLLAHELPQEFVEEQPHHDGSLV
jgi:zinc transporter ZupT